MKLLKKVSTILAVFCMLLLGCITVHASNDGQWKMMPEKFNVPLNKPWTVVFTQDVTPDKIDGMAVYNEQTNMYIPTNIELFSSSNKKQVKIAPVNNYDSNTKYSLRIFLNNGKRIKMYFNTQNLNNLEYIDFSELHNKCGGPFEYYGDLAAFRSNYVFEIRQVEFSGENSIKFWDSDWYEPHSSCSYLLDKKYRKLTASYAAADYIDADETTTIQIYGDGKELLNATCKRGDKPVYFELDITGIDKIEFKSDHDGALIDLKLGFTPGTNLDK